MWKTQDTGSVSWGLHIPKKWGQWAQTLEPFYAQKSANSLRFLVSLIVIIFCSYNLLLLAKFLYILAPLASSKQFSQHYKMLHPALKSYSFPPESTCALHLWGFPGVPGGKEPNAGGPREMQFDSWVAEESWRKGMAIHSVFAHRSELQSVQSQGVGHNWPLHTHSNLWVALFLNQQASNCYPVCGLFKCSMGAPCAHFPQLAPGRIHHVYLNIPAALCGNTYSLEVFIFSTIISISQNF